MGEYNSREAINIAEHTRYTNQNYIYLKNVNIVEWDIKSAGLSILKYYKLLPEKQLQELESLDKTSRVVKEGLLQKENPALADKIIESLAELRKIFIVENQIPAEAILSIKKDAIFLINQNPRKTLIKNFFTFRKKGVYTSYLNLNKIEFYYSSALNELDTKGIPKVSVEAQKDFILKDIKNILKIGEKISSEELFKILQEYRRKYLNKKLPIEVYKELNTNLYRLDRFLSETISPETDLERLDISQNYMSYILPLIQAML